MYKHVREVKDGLILSLIFTVNTSAVAIVDPFNNGVPWVNWLSMTVVAILAVAASTVLAVMADEEGDFWGWLGILVGGWLVFGGMFFWMATTDIRPEYHSLVWTTFAIPLAIMPVAALVHYLVAASDANRNQTSLRRVA